MTKTTVYVLVGFGVVLLAITALIFIAIVIRSSLSDALIFFAIMAGILFVGSSTIFSALDTQRLSDNLRRQPPDNDDEGQA